MYRKLLTLTATAAVAATAVAPAAGAADSAAPTLVLRAERRGDDAGKPLAG
jgi:hypothetical protein